VSKLELYFNYPHYQQPQFVIDLLNEQRKKIEGMTFSDQVHILFAYRYIYDAVTDEEIKKML
jgi:hypothetical protein